MSSGVVPCSSPCAGTGRPHAAEAPPGGSELRGDHLQEGQRVEAAATATPGDEDAEELIAALDWDGDEGSDADLAAAARRAHSPTGGGRGS